MERQCIEISKNIGLQPVLTCRLSSLFSFSKAWIGLLKVLKILKASSFTSVSGFNLKDYTIDIFVRVSIATHVKTLMQSEAQEKMMCVEHKLPQPLAKKK
jgi:hypothetical protein